MNRTLGIGYGPALAAAFSPVVMRSLSREIFSEPRTKPALHRIASTVVEQPGATLGDAFNSAFEILSRRYRGEYIYKNGLVSKLVFGRHSPATASALLEIPMGSSCADLMVVNGTTTVYEIKTDLDQFSRLDVQLRDYSTRAEHVFVVTSEKRAELAIARAPENVGVLGLRRNGSFATFREAKSNLGRLESAHLFGMLRPREASAVLHRLVGWEAPTDQAAAWNGSLRPRVAHSEVVSQLRMRSTSIQGLVIDPRFPRSLRALAYLEEHSRIGVERMRSRLTSLASDFLGLAPN